jgi:hypothetical protein
MKILQTNQDADVLEPEARRFGGIDADHAAARADDSRGDLQPASRPAPEIDDVVAGVDQPARELVELERGA